MVVSSQEPCGGSAPHQYQDPVETSGAAAHQPEGGDGEMAAMAKSRMDVVSSMA